MKNWQKQERVIEHDVHHYYGYLPAWFIFDDIKIEKSNYQYGDNLYYFWPNKTAEGKQVFKMSMGVAYLYAPFFFMAHGYALLNGDEPNGFSEPYKLFLLVGAAFYLLLGLIFIKKILRLLDFSDTNAALSILLVGMGTNLLCYASQSGTYSHVYSFCLTAGFIYFIIKWQGSFNAMQAVVLGLLFGLISLIRPTNAVILLFFVLYGVTGKSSLLQRLKYLLAQYRALLLFLFCAGLVWLPQFMYWKEVTGHWLVYSYTNESFFFTRPHILSGLFSFRKGWLVYTPVMAFAIAGIFLLRDQRKKLKIPVILFLLVNAYVMFSWWCWWYGGSYGQRSMVDSYALMAIPLAAFIEYAGRQNRAVWIVLAAFSAFFIWLNIFQIYQFEQHSLHYDGMSRQLYFKQFGKLEKISGFEEWIDWPDYEQAKRGGSGTAENQAPEGNSTQHAKAIKTISLKAPNGRYVCADEGLGHIVVADKESASTWETFSLLELQGGRALLLSHRNRFFSADIGGSGELSADRTQALEWEQFTINYLSNNKITIKAYNGKYISFDEGSKRLYARSAQPGPLETFEWTTTQ